MSSKYFNGKKYVDVTQIKNKTELILNNPFF